MLRIPTALFTDGGLLTQNPSEIGGTWAFVAVDENDRKVFFKSGVVLASKLDIPFVSNNHTEHVALIKAMESVPEGWTGIICSDSEVALTRVRSDYDLSHGVRRFPAAENNLPPIISSRSKAAASRLGYGVSFVLLQGHPTRKDLETGVGKKRNLPVSKWNVWCDERCNEEKSRYRELTQFDQLDKLIKEHGEKVLEASGRKLAKKTKRRARENQV